MQLKDNMTTRGRDHDLLFADAAGLRPTLRLHRDAEAIQSVSGAGGKGQPGRVRHGFVDRELRILPDAQPVGLGAGSRRQQRRSGGGGCGFRVRLLARLGHRRQYSSAGVAMRSRRTEAPPTALYPAMAWWHSQARSTRLGQSLKTSPTAPWRLNAIAGHDPKGLDIAERWTFRTTRAALGRDLRGLRIGVPTGVFRGRHGVRGRGGRPGTPSLCWKSLGAEVVETSLPHTAYALAVYYILAPSECSANLARYDGVKYGFSDRDSDSMWEALEQTRGIAVSGLRSSAGSCWARTRCPPDTTTPST